jgi:hypothetical protein
MLGLHFSMSSQHLRTQTQGVLPNMAGERVTVRHACCPLTAIIEASPFCLGWPGC